MSASAICRISIAHFAGALGPRLARSGGHPRAQVRQPHAASRLQHRRRDMAAEDLNNAIERSHASCGGDIQRESGTPKTLFSNEDDITLGNPFGPFARGRGKVVEPFTATAKNYRGGKVTTV